MPDPQVRAIVSGDSSELKAAVVSAEETLSGLQSKAGDIARQLAALAGTTDTSTKQFKEFGRSLSDTQSTIRTLSAATSAMKATIAATEQPLKGMGNNLESIKKSAAAAGAAINSSGGAFAKLQATVKASHSGLSALGKILGGVGLAMKGVFAAATYEATKFEEKMRDVNSVAKLSEPEFARTSMMVQTLSPRLNLNQSPTVLAEAEYPIASAGFTGDAGVKVLEASAKLASSGLTDAKTTALAMVGVLDAYGLSAEHAAEVADHFQKVVDTGVIRMGDLATGIGEVLPFAAKAGVGFDELGAAISTLSNKGMQSGQIMAGLSNLLASLAAPKRQSRKYLAMLGIDPEQIGEAAIKAKGLDGVLEYLRQKTFGGDFQLMTLALGGNKNAAAAAFNLSANHSTDFKKNKGSQKNSQGAVDAALEQQRKSLAFQLGALKASMESLGITIGNAFIPFIKPVVAGLNAIVKAMVRMPEGTVQTIAQIGLVAAGFATLAGAAFMLLPQLTAMGALFEGGALAGVLPGMAAMGAEGLAAVGGALASLGSAITAGATAALSGITGAVGAVWGALAGGFATVTTAFGALMEGLTGLGAAVAALADPWLILYGVIQGFLAVVAALTSPITIAIGAIVLLAGAFAENWDVISTMATAAVVEVGRTISEGFTGIKNAAIAIWGTLWASFKPIVDVAAQELRPILIGIGSFIGSIWPPIKAIVSDTFQLIVKIVQAAIAAIGGTLSFLASLFATAWDAIKLALIPAWDYIEAIIRSALEVVRGVMAAFLAAAQGNWKEAWDKITGILKNVGSIWQDEFRNIFDRLLEVLTRMRANFYDAGAKLMSALHLGMTDAMAKGAKGTADMLRQEAENMARAREAGAAGPDGKPREIYGPPSPTAADIKKNQEAEARRQKAEDEANAEKARKFKRDHLSGDQSKKHHTSKAAQEEAHRQAFAQSLKSLVGLSVGANECAATMHKAANKIGIILTGSEQGYDAAQTQGLGHGKNFADYFYSQQAGQFFRDKKNVKIGDLALFQGTANDPRTGRKFEQGIPTHVGGVVGFNPDGSIIMVDASSSAGKVVMRSINQFSPANLLGFVHPTALSGKAGSDENPDVKKMEEARRKDKETLDTYLQPDRNEFDDQRAQAQKDYAEASAIARVRGESSEVFGKIEQTYLDKLKEIADAELQAKLKAADDIQQAILNVNGKTYEQIRLQANAVERQIKTALDKGLITPEQAKTARGDLAKKQTKAQGAVDDAWGDSIMQGIVKQRQEDTKAVQDHMRQIQEDRQEGKISASEALQQIAEEVNARKGSEQEHASVLKTFTTDYKSYLNEQLKLQGDNGIEWLQQQRQQILASGDQSEAAMTKLATVNQAIQQQQRQIFLQIQNQIKSVIQNISTSFGNFFTNILDGHKKFGDAFKQLWQDIEKTVIQSITNMIAKMIEMKIEQALLGVFGGVLGDMFGNIFGGIPSFADSSMFSGVPGDLPIAHTGGVVVPGGIATFHDGGMAGWNLRPDEVLAKLQTGEMVLSRQMVSNLAQGGTGASGTQTGEQPNLGLSITGNELHFHYETDVDAFADRVYTEFGRRFMYEQQGRTG